MKRYVTLIRKATIAHGSMLMTTIATSGYIQLEPVILSGSSTDHSGLWPSKYHERNHSAQINPITSNG